MCRDELWGRHGLQGGLVSHMVGVGPFVINDIVRDIIRVTPRDPRFPTFLLFFFPSAIFIFFYFLVIPTFLCGFVLQILPRTSKCRKHPKSANVAVNIKTLQICHNFVAQNLKHCNVKE